MYNNFLRKKSFKLQHRASYKVNESKDNKKLQVSIYFKDRILQATVCRLVDVEKRYSESNPHILGSIYSYISNYTVDVR